MPVITTAAIAKFIGSGLAAAGWGAVEENILKPGMKPVVNPVKGFLESGKADKALRDAVEKAFTAIDAPQGEKDVSGYAMRLGFGKLQSKGAANAQEREMVARTALLMRSANPDEVPNDVYKALNWPSEHRAELAQFLYAVRQELTANEEWNVLVEYSEREAVRHYLSLGLRSQERREEMLAALLAHYNIASASQDEKALESYLHFVRVHYHSLSFDFFKSRRQGNIDEAELDAVFVPLQMHDSARDDKMDAENLRRGRLGAEDMDMVREKSMQSMTIAEVLERESVFLLRGKPGSGKSTLLRYIALSFARNEAQERLGWTGDKLLPILVPLASFNRNLQGKSYASYSARPLRLFIEEYFRNRDIPARFPPDFFRDRLMNGRCLVLLDGLDEVADHDARIDVAQFVAAFIDRYSEFGNRFVLASRPKGYDDVAVYLTGPTVFNVQNLTPEGRDVLVGKLLRHSYKVGDAASQTGKARKKREDEIIDLIDDIRRKSTVDELSRNPLFCTILILVYKYMDARLPERRVDVYEQVVNLMLGRWAVHRSKKEGVRDARQGMLQDGTGRIYREEKDARVARTQALRHIAYWMQQDVKKTEVGREAVEAELARYLAKREGKPEDEMIAPARGFLEAIHRYSDLYRAVNPETYAFSHRSFLEYLAATALVGKREGEMEAAILKYAESDWWHDVLVLAAAHPSFDDMPDKRDWLFEDILLANDHAVLAGECAVDTGERLSPSMRNKVLARLYAQMTNMKLPSQERFDAGEQWDALGGPPEDGNKWLKCRACGDGKEDLLVGKYPVTNAQFALFMAADGYEKAEFWDDEESVGWQWRLENHPDYRGEGAVQTPEYWRDTRFGRERRGFPVVGVSWHEAQAYCRWLTHLLERVLAGDETVQVAERALVADLAAAGTREVRLLRETEWEQAAGGKQNDRYPWDKGIEATETGNTGIITARANVSKSAIGQTTPTAMYPDGASPFGLQDMAGNVWEWTESFYDDDKDSYAVRGGSWDDDQRSARVAGRGRYGPRNSDYVIGFRAVSPVVLSSGS